MRRKTTPGVTLFALFLFIVLAGCGDVGDAPVASTGAAIDVNMAGDKTLTIDRERSQINWRGAKVTRAHDGGFSTFDGTITETDGQVSGVRIRIDATSIFSDTERLTNHLKSDDFFAVETYPEAIFEADRFEPVDSTGATHIVTGNLTMHGQTNSISFPATITKTDNEIRATADFVIDRQNWGISYMGQADDLISDEVRIMFDVVASEELVHPASEQIVVPQ
jgi:polyisoprenoid-binding protein YceI